MAIEHKVSCDKKQIVIHNGIKELYRSHQVKKSSEKVSLIMVARFSEQKDHETLLKALANLKDLNWELNLVGKGKLESKYMEFSNEVGISEKVNFLGQRDDVDILLSNSDIFLLISHWEGYPLSTLEAMRARLPVIVSDVGGNNEAIKQGVNGYLIERKDIEGLTKVLRTLINDKSLREKLGDYNIKEFQEKHTVEKMYAKTLSVYQTCSKNNRVNL